MNTQFKTLEEKDLTEVKKIYDWYIANTTVTFHIKSVSTEELKEFIYINHLIYRSYLVFCDDNIAGYCYLTCYKKREAFDRTAEIAIYLKPEYCNNGIGKIAFCYLENEARKSGLKNIIGNISGDNSESIALFEKSGYTKCAHFKNVGEKFNSLLDVVSFQKEIG